MFLCMSAFSAAESIAADDDVLTVIFSGGGVQLDPAHSYTTTEAQIYTAVYEGLVSYHPLTLEPLPAAASRWVVSPDGRTYTFFLRPDGKYWNNSRVEASHFRDAWLRILEPEENAEYSFMFDIIKGAYEYRTGQTDDKQDVGITAITPLILEIKLKEPADYFLKILCHHSFSPVHPLNIKNGQWKDGPSAVGNGPFYIFSRNDDRIVLKKNILYWDSVNTGLSGINIEFSNDPEANTKRFNRGEVQWGASGIYFNMLEDPENIVTNPLFATTYLFFTSFDEALKNPDVRRGLSLIIKWEDIRNRDNYFLPSSSLVPSIPGYPEVGGIERRDMKEALQLLHKAGYTKGRGINPLMIRIPDGEDMIGIASILKEQWEKYLDVDVEIETLSYSDYFGSLKEPGYSIGTTTWIGDYADPLTFLQMWTASSNLNDSGYDNPVYDSLLEEAVKSPPKERYALMAEAEKILLDGAVLLPLENYPAFNAVNLERLEGWFPNVLDIHPFKYLSLVSPRLPDGLVRYNSRLP